MQARITVVNPFGSQNNFPYVSNESIGSFRARAHIPLNLALVFCEKELSDGDTTPASTLVVIPRLQTRNCRMAQQHRPAAYAYTATGQGQSQTLCSWCQEKHCICGEKLGKLLAENAALKEENASLKSLLNGALYLRRSAKL